jgi:dimethylaniline monooxygenase (N-oxide forming)
LAAQTYDYLDGDMRARLDLQKDGLYLYRNCLPYAVPHLAFVGSEVSTYNNILTQGLQVRAVSLAPSKWRLTPVWRVT